MRDAEVSRCLRFLPCTFLSSPEGSSRVYDGMRESRTKTEATTQTAYAIHVGKCTVAFARMRTRYFRNLLQDRGIQNVRVVGLYTGIFLGYLEWAFYIFLCSKTFK